MKAVLALLLGLSTIAFADKDGEEFSWDSGDEGTPSGYYEGIVVQVYNPTDGEPVITLGTNADNHQDVYCLNLIRTFEAIGYDLTQTTSSDDDYTEVDGSSVDLKNANCEVTETSPTTFTIGCSGINGGDLDFDFTFIADTDESNDGLEYTITLENYDFVSDDPEAQLVLVQSVEECSNKYSYSGESGDDSEEEEDDDSANDDTDTTDEPDDGDDSMVTRRLLNDDGSMDEPETSEVDDMNDDDSNDTDDSDDDNDDDSDSDSAESEDGISSDDSDEFDAGFSQFIADGQAVDRCDDGDTNIDSQLIYDDDEDELHIVFNHFNCTLFIDPKFTLDESKIVASSKASSIFGVIGLVVGLFGALLI